MFSILNYCLGNNLFIKDNCKRQIDKICLPMNLVKYFATFLLKSGKFNELLSLRLVSKKYRNWVDETLHKKFEMLPLKKKSFLRFKYIVICKLFCERCNVQFKFKMSDENLKERIFETFFGRARFKCYKGSEIENEMVEYFIKHNYIDLTIKENLLTIISNVAKTLKPESETISNVLFLRLIGSDCISQNAWNDCFRHFLCLPSPYAIKLLLLTGKIDPRLFINETLNISFSNYLLSEYSYYPFLKILVFLFNEERVIDSLSKQEISQVKENPEYQAFFEKNFEILFHIACKHGCLNALYFMIRNCPASKEYFIRFHYVQLHLLKDKEKNQNRIIELFTNKFFCSNKELFAAMKLALELREFSSAKIIACKITGNYFTDLVAKIMGFTG